MKKKVKCRVYLSRRLYRVVEDIIPLFLDLEANTPERGAFSRALDYIIQSYMESEDYRKKLMTIKAMRWNLFLCLTDKNKEFKN